MRLRLLLGPAGSGKTFRCLAELRETLSAAPDGPPLLLVAPRQTTYQLERQLLGDDSGIRGYTRLHILSFERLAHFIFERLQMTEPKMLDEEGRIMVLRGLLAKRRDALKLFRASARLTGFAQQLSNVLRELQRNQVTPETLRHLAAQTKEVAGLADKLHDFALLLESYLEWLRAHELQDADCLLEAAVQALRSEESLGIGGLWIDGFSEFSTQELDLIAAIIPHCDGATLTFCLERVPSQKFSWLSNWSVPQQSFERCRTRLQELAGAELKIELLERETGKTRFTDNPILQQLEAAWSGVDAPLTAKQIQSDAATLASSLRIVSCPNPVAEAILAAREIRRHVRDGGRYRDVMVLVRQLENYYQVLERILSRYEIPFFLDRRESVSHHPLAELTRNALRTVAFYWQRDDWFAALKTGLLGVEERELDELENEALARGWKGAAWHEPIRLKDVPKSNEERQRLEELQKRLEQLRKQIMPAFQKLGLLLAAEQNKPSGSKLTAAVREFWKIAKVEQRLEEWASGHIFGPEFRTPNSVHSTVWSEMNEWLHTVEMAFADERLPMREWLPILEAGLANLTVGVIPPALDQVLIGPVDRSRNPDIKLAIVLGMNESVFPARPELPALFTEADCATLQKRNIGLNIGTREQLARERHYAYVACSRARERLVLTYALHDADGTPLNPSPFVSRVRQIFPSLEIESASAEADWRESEHACELVTPVLSAVAAGAGERNAAGLELLAESPALAPVVNRLKQFDNFRAETSLSPGLARRLYGANLRTSVSRMEQFAACPFKFFVHSGLRAEERKLFEFDVKEKGTFQHDVLAEFHNQLRHDKLHWRDITPQEARARVGRIAQAFIASYREGLLEATEQSRFTGKLLTHSLQDFIETLVLWMREQYKFDPVAVELPFGEEGSAPWRIALDDGRSLELHGRIDRVDLYRNSANGNALCVVVDYKSSRKQLDQVFLANGLQLQLLAYLNVIRQWPNAGESFGSENLIPAGVFYVNLRGQYEKGSHRLEALAEPEQFRKRAYRHAGRFDSAALSYLDARPDARVGDQFNYRLTNQGKPYKNASECLSTQEFLALLNTVEANLKRMGTEIYSGKAGVSPYRKGSATACDQCDYSSICRIDPWTHQYRLLKKIDDETD